VGGEPGNEAASLALIYFRSVGGNF